MAGHSKWANIKHRKGSQDAKRGKLFAKLSKEITVAASLGTPDPSTNASLRLAITKAKAKSMPKKNIEAAIDKAKGNNNGANYKEIAYGANVSGVSFLINCLTDNINRVSAEVQHLINRMNGSVASPSSVSYIFDHKGVLAIKKENKNEDELMMLALESGAKDFQVEDDLYVIYTEPNNFSKVKDNLEKQNIIEFKIAEVKYIPNQEISLPEEKIKKILDLIDKLEDNNDIQDVYHNLNISILEEK